jgi:uncharacterized protein YxjI
MSTRFVMKSKFGVGRDFSVTDENDQQVLYVDGKLGATPKAEIQDSTGTVRYRVHGKFLGVPKKMVIEDAAGNEVASMKAKTFSPIKSKVDMHLADGSEWKIEGSLVEKNYAAECNGAKVVEISQKWVTVRDSYSLEVADGVEPAFAAAVVWAIDRWVEKD